MKSEVQVLVVPPLPLPKQQQQLEGHKLPTTACNQAPAQLEGVESQRLKVKGNDNPLLNHYMKLYRGDLDLNIKPSEWALESFWVWW